MKRFASFLLPLLLLSATTASAAMFRHEEHLSLSVPVRDDLYAAGGSVHVDAEVTGDLFAGGGNVTVSAPIRGDLFVGAGNIRVQALVSDDVRLAGGTVILEGEVSGDLLVAGGQITLDRTARVRGDVIISGGDVTIRGPVDGDIRVYAGNVVLEGPVAGNAEVHGGNIIFNARVTGGAILAAERITAGSSASVGKDLRYWQEEGEMTFPSVGGVTTFDTDLRPQRHDDAAKGIIAFAIGWILFWMLSGIVIVLILVLVTKKFFVDAAARLRAAPGFSFLWGLLYMIVVPVIGVLLLLSVIGIPLALLVFASYAFTWAFSGPLTAVVFAKLWEGYRRKRWNKPMTFLVSVGVYVLLTVLAFIPILGWLAKLVAVLFAIGAILATKYEIWKKAA